MPRLPVLRALTLAVLAPLLTTCAAGPSARADVRGDAPFTLAPGTSVRHADSGLDVEFVRVTADSRCPADVQCVWQGDATVRVETRETDAVTAHELHTAGRPASAVVGAFRLRLVALSPERRSGAAVEPRDYRVTLRMERSG